MEQIEQERAFMDLVEGIRDYQAQRFEAAHLSWGQWTQQQDHILGYFARSLAANLSSTEQRENLYTQQPLSEEKQIDLFREMAQLPLVRWPRLVTEKLHEEGREENSTHLELGIGSGEHAEQLVVASGGHTTKVIGVDLDPENVKVSGERLKKLGVEYVGIAAAFNKLDWTQLRRLAGPRPTVDAAFALHHLSLAEKRRALRGIASLRPRLVTLIEPSSDHWSADLLTRFVNAYSHFHAVGELILSLDTSQLMRRNLLQFFGREIEDIMRDSPERYERHERWTFWHGELLRSGLIPKELQTVISSSKLQGVDTKVLGPGVATITADSVPLVSVFAFGRAEN